MKKIEIDCSGITTPEQLHEALRQALSFPDWYGNNLDALFDCLTEDFTDRELILRGYHALQYALKDYCEKALYVFKCACEENPHLIVTLHP